MVSEWEKARWQKVKVLMPSFTRAEGAQPVSDRIRLRQLVLPSIFTFTFLIAILLTQPSITTATCKKPSKYAAALPSSARLALIGTAAPCSTGCANSGLRLLGKMDGKILLRAVPSV